MDVQAYRRKKLEMAYKRSVLDSPAASQGSYKAGAKKHVGYRNCPMYLSQDSGYNDSLKAFGPDSEDSRDSLDNRTLSQDYENSENVDPTLRCSPLHETYLVSGARSKNSSRTAEIYETPRVAKKDPSLRRRLLSKATPSGSLDFDASNSSDEKLGRKTTVKRIPSFEAGLCRNAIDSPRDVAYKPLATSTLKTESDSSLSCKKWRLSFAQQRSSTIDETKGDAGTFPEVENLSPVKRHIESTDGSLSSNEENLTELYATPNHKLIPDVEAFQTPMSNLAASFHFDLCTPTRTPLADLENSITEDSAFHSLSLDKSQDSISDHEGSFQELIPKQKETSKSTHSKTRLRKLDRCKRLSTLRERGSQSEVEEESKDSHILSSLYKSKVTRNSVTEECEFNFDDGTNHSLLKAEDLTGTPALRVVCEMVVRSTQKRAHRATIQELVGSLDSSGGSEDELTRLIGRKMGLEQIDILSELKYRNLKHLISFIFKILDVESICSISNVSKGWCEMVVQDKDAYQRRKLFQKQLRVETEKGWKFSEDAATRINLNRSALKLIQTQVKSVCHTPTSRGVLTPKDTAPFPQSARKQQEYVKIARTLFTDEALKPCPQCQYPAKYQPLKKRGKCSKKDCGFDFCILCLCAFHGSKECSGGSGKRVHKKEVLAGSAQSKRNLKRL